MILHALTKVRPDGRTLHLYGREALEVDLEALAPARDAGAPHLRWHPLREEWVVYAAHRQTRTFLPPPNFDPLRPSADPAAPTEVPAGNWEVAVFENRFAALRADATDAPSLFVPTGPAVGACEVVVYTPDAGGSLGGLEVEHISLVMAVWAERTRELGGRPDIQYVFPFENRGEAVGVTLHHPHGQIYAYPFVPPLPARFAAAEVRHLAERGVPLLTRLIGDEERDGRRVLYAGPHAVAWVPVCARYAYEVWVAPRRAAWALPDLADDERLDLARALRAALGAYDRLWDAPLPYVMGVYQAPTDGRPHPEAHLHLELWPPHRARGRLKFLAGTELGTGTFVADTLPEEKAAELRAAMER